MEIQFNQVDRFTSTLSGTVESMFYYGTLLDKPINSSKYMYVIHKCITRHENNVEFIEWYISHLWLYLLQKKEGTAAHQQYYICQWHLSSKLWWHTEYVHKECLFVMPTVTYKSFTWNKKKTDENPILYTACTTIR